MNNRSYRKWIEAGFKNYGQDPWFFIRELAQNSRDAGANSIHVNAGHTDRGEEFLTFEDDGRGMPYAYAKRYLFRLYASSKTHEKYSAGMFGIGFWTTLTFNPSSILIESFFKNKKWAILVDSELKTRIIDCRLSKNGTRITLVRPQSEKTLEDYCHLIENSLIRYCSYLRRNTPKFSPLPVFFSGKRITFPMRLKSQISMNFKRGPVEGVVGFSSKPKVYLYAKGLPVWVATYLDELSHIPPVKSKYKDTPRGLAPVFIINGNNLNVNISRKRIIDDSALKNTRNTAEDALDQLIESIAYKVSPGQPLDRILNKIKRISINMKNSFWKSLAIILLIALPVEFAVLKTFFTDQPEIKIPSSISIKTDNNQYAGASVTRAHSLKAIDLSYTPPRDMLFKLYNVDNYEIVSGFTKILDSKSLERYKKISIPYDCQQESYSIEINSNESGTLYLPKPIFFSLDPDSITANNQSLPPVLYTSSDDVVISLTRKGIIRYKCCPLKRAEKPSKESLLVLTTIPEGFSFPSSLQHTLDRAFVLSTEDKIQLALQLTFGILRYDTSANTAKKYENSSEEEWFQKVNQVGAGDCDILSGVNILFLRKMGIPSRLAIGLIGKRGRIAEGMHAWTEYYDNGWHMIDTTLYSPPETSNFPVPSRREVAPGHSENVARESDSTGANPDSTSPGESFFSKLPGQELILLTILLAGSFLGIFFTARRKIYSNIVHGKDINKIREDLAGMAIHALLHPGVWGENSHIMSFKLIPTIQGKSISLNQALKLIKSKKLFYLSPANPMVKVLKKAGLPIVESGHSAFDPLIKLLPGAINLNRVTSLGATKPESFKNQDLGKLLLAVNQFISPPCFPASGLATEDFLDIDLSHLPSSIYKLGLLRQFIAVNPESKRVKSLVSQYQTNEKLAQFKLIKIILKESNLCPTPSQELLKQVAKSLLGKI